MFAKFLACLALMAALSQQALAADWQYCLAPSQADHKVYISPPFPSNGEWGKPDNALDQMLNRSGLKHDVIQCPRADDHTSIEIMRQEAIRYNHLNGNEIVNLKWSP